MHINGLGDPCQPHEQELALGGDRKELAVRAVYRIGYAKWPEKWVTKAELFDVLADMDDEDLDWFGPLEGDDAKGSRNKIGMALKSYHRRILDGVCLTIEQNGKGAQQKVRFSAEGGGKKAENGNLRNLGNLIIPAIEKK